MIHCSGRGVVSIRVGGRIQGTFLSCSVDIVIRHTLPSIESKLGPIREHVLCAVFRGGLCPRGTCEGYTSAINTMLNHCRPRNSTSICSTVIELTRAFSVHCVLISNRNGFNAVSNSPTTTCECARSHVDGVDVHVLRSVSGSAISFGPGCSSHLGRPSILPAEFPGLLMGNSSNVTINVTAGVPPRGVGRIIRNIGCLVSRPSYSSLSLVRYVGKPSFPATNVVVNAGKVGSTCAANHNGVCLHTHTRVIRRGNSRFGVVMARLPCRIHGTTLVTDVTSLIGSGHLRNVSNVGSFAGEGNVRVRVSIGESTGTRIILGGLCGVARVRMAFNIVVLTLISNIPGVLGLGRVLRGCVGFERRIVAHHAGCSLGGTRTETRVLSNLHGTVSVISRVVTAVESYGNNGDRTGLTVVRGFNFSSPRTATVMGFRLNRLTKLRVRGVAGRLTRLGRGVTSCRSVLTGRDEIFSVVGSRSRRVIGGFSSSHEARVDPIVNSISSRSLVPIRRSVLALAGVNCVGHVAISACGTRGHNKENVVNVDHHRRSITGAVFDYSSRSIIFLFAGANGIFHGGTCRVPTSSEANGNVGIIGLLPLRGNRAISTVIGVPRSRGHECLYVMAGGNIVGHASVSRCGRVERDNVVTIGLSRNSRLTCIRVASKGEGLIITARGNVDVYFGRSSTHLVNEATENIETVTLTRNSCIINFTTRVSNFGLLAISRANFNEGDRFSSCHIRDENNGNLVGCHYRRFNGITVVTPISSSGSIVVVADSNVIVHARTSRVSAFLEPDGNIGIVGIGRNRGVTAVSVISEFSRRTSNRAARRDNRTSRGTSGTDATRTTPTRRWTGLCVFWQDEV